MIKDSINIINRSTQLLVVSSLNNTFYIFKNITEKQQGLQEQLSLGACDLFKWIIPKISSSCWDREMWAIVMLLTLRAARFCKTDLHFKHEAFVSELFCFGLKSPAVNIKTPTSHPQSSTNIQFRNSYFNNICNHDLEVSQQLLCKTCLWYSLRHVEIKENRNRKLGWSKCSNQSHYAHVSCVWITSCFLYWI